MSHLHAAHPVLALRRTSKTHRHPPGQPAGPRPPLEAGPRSVQWWTISPPRTSWPPPPSIVRSPGCPTVDVQSPPHPVAVDDQTPRLPCCGPAVPPAPCSRHRQGHPPASPTQPGRRLARAPGPPWALIGRSPIQRRCRALPVRPAPGPATLEVAEPVPIRLPGYRSTARALASPGGSLC